MYHFWKAIAVILFSSSFFSPFQATAQNMREPTREERDWDMTVTGEIQKLLLDASYKMKQNWHNKMLDPKLSSGFRRDVTEDPYIPIQLRCQLWLQFDVSSDEYAKIEEGITGDFNDKVEKLMAENNFSVIAALDNPYFKDEIIVDVIVNPNLLFHFPIDTTKAPPAGVTIMKKEGIQLYFIKTFPPDPNNWIKPITIVYSGDPTVIFGKNGKPAHSFKSKVKSTDVKVICFEIHTSPSLAEEFIDNLDLKALARIIEKY
ncbi:MAG: hypothetical protein C4560_08850 [Nitrospiraceae bacterium]|nr:MAG: hypothetical protein C4560_08850 [Nitrospiraceae bacterium]